MNIAGIDLISFLSQLTGISAGAVAIGLGDAIDTLAPGWGKKTLAVLAIVSFGAGQLLRILRNPSPPAGTVSLVTKPLNGERTFEVTTASVAPVQVKTQEPVSTEK